MQVSHGVTHMFMFTCRYQFDPGQSDCQCYSDGGRGNISQEKKLSPTACKFLFYTKNIKHIMVETVTRSMIS